MGDRHSEAKHVIAYKKHIHYATHTGGWLGDWCVIVCVFRWLCADVFSFLFCKNLFAFYGIYEFVCIYCTCGVLNVRILLAGVVCLSKYESWVFVGMARGIERELERCLHAWIMSNEYELNILRAIRRIIDQWSTSAITIILIK